MAGKHGTRKRHKEFKPWHNARTTCASGEKSRAQPTVPPLWKPAQKYSTYLLQVMTATQRCQSTMTSKLPRPPDALHQRQLIWTNQILLKMPLPTPPPMQTPPLPLPLPPPLLQMEVASSPSTDLQSDQMIPMPGSGSEKLSQVPTVIATLTKTVIVIATLTKTSAKCWKI
jgi:hypothetical protein